ncbi:hypothetical protein CTI14_34930 [Methylobacterium radiotolerans]|nr:hypothetical protein CTI14_34930 [Methylobacterium radiotolerans]
MFLGLLLLRGGASGPEATATKSTELVFVSVHPFPARITAFVLLGAGAGAFPSYRFAAPAPTKSTTLSCVAEVGSALELVRATLKAVPLILKPQFV